jgi:hypothetical protein
MGTRRQSCDAATVAAHDRRAPRLAPAPPDLARTRRALHAVAEWVLAPAHQGALEHIGLRVTPGGFGTPPLPRGRRVRVAGTELAVEAGGRTTTSPLSTLRDAANVAGVEPGRATGVFAPATPWDADAPLGLDPEGARCIADWFAFSDVVLEELRATTESPAIVQLWPEHFDLAFDAGDEAGGQRVNLGASPGDDGHSLPYLYVGPWARRAWTDAFWNEPFGASLGYDVLVAADDQRATALAFLRRGIELAAAP